MNLYLRLIIAFIRGSFLAPIKPTDELTRSLRVLPNDIDINGHLNNGRYATLVDLLIIEQGMRVGILAKALKLGWKPMTASGLISYRKQLKPFEKFTVHYKMDCWDEKWAYMHFRFVKRDGSLAAVGYFKCGFVSSKGLVPQSQVDQKFSLNRGDCELHPTIQLWKQSEQALMDRAATSF